MNSLLSSPLLEAMPIVHALRAWLERRTARFIQADNLREPRTKSVAVQIAPRSFPPLLTVMTEVVTKNGEGARSFRDLP
jgi:hypothetical protein